MRFILIILYTSFLSFSAVAADQTEIPQWMQVSSDSSQASWESSTHYKEGIKCVACHGQGIEPLSKLQDSSPQSWKTGELLSIKPEKRVYYDNLCVRCHAPAKNNFLHTFHGKHSSLGKKNIPTCSYCHVAHEASLTSQANALHPDSLGRVCAGCHAGSEKEQRQIMASNLAGPDTGATLYGHDVFGIGPLHFGNIIDSFYILLLITVLGFIVFYIVIDFPVALKGRRALTTSQNNTLRFTIGQRIQHALLALSFITLAITGFAVMYPDSSYAQWLMSLLGGADNRSLIHRLAAIVFAANGLIHLFYYLFFYRGSHSILLNRQDLHHALNDIRYRLGKADKPIEAGKYDWLQKLEYWAGVIGLFIVLITGLVMWFFEWSLSHLPYQIFKYAQWIHGWEAILATSVLLILHGYSTIINPRIFPMDWSWITGRKNKK